MCVWSICVDIHDMFSPMRRFVTTFYCVGVTSIKEEVSVDLHNIVNLMIYKINEV